jgi:lysozyme
MMMKLSPRGRALMQAYESCKLTAYPDPLTGGEPFTIGWGSTGPDICKGLVWTQKQCDDRFAQKNAEFEGYVNRAVIVPLTQGQFDAMVSIVSNVGPGGPKRDGIIQLKNGMPSTLLRRLNSLDYAGAAAQFLVWVSPGSNVEAGLRRRRIAEVALFNEVPRGA